MTETAFEGASTGFRLQQKGLLRGSPETLAARELKLLWQRSHHLCRNNPAAITARNRLVAHWVGTGITVRWDNKKVQKAWEEFIASPSIDGHGTLANIQNLWGTSLFESGEVFARMLIKKSNTTIPLKLQVIEAEQLDPAYFSANNRIKNGIEFDSTGNIPKNYHFFKQHPMRYISGQAYVRQSVDANDILHIFNRERPTQWRGIPKLAPAMLTIYEMDELTDAALVRQKAAQAIGWIIKKRETGAAPLLGAMQEGSTELSQEDLQDISSKRIQKILPGGVHYLQEDEDFDFAAVDDIGNNFVALLEHNWRMIAGCLDLTYEQLTGDLTKVNFSSIRAGLIEFRRRVATMQKLVFVNLALRPLTERFKELSSVYINKEAGQAKCEFVFPKQEWVDPYKDAQADILEIQAGLATLREKLEERGVVDIDAHLKQLQEEQGYDIILTSNPAVKAKPNVSKTKANEVTQTQPKG